MTRAVVPLQAIHRSIPTRARPFAIMAKPRGAICNLDCEYCYYLDKADLYPGSRFRMTDRVLEQYVSQYIASQNTREVVFSWQGGEPTLLGIGFFETAIALQEKHRRPGTTISNVLQTNGVLVDDEWAAFFAENGFLVGVSLDGPEEMHDRYRRDRGGGGTYRDVMAGLARLQAHGVDYNILCTVHAANAESPMEVYRLFRDRVGARYLQFIPIVERCGGSEVSHRSVTPEAYGAFLIAIFDEWVHNDVGTMFVQLFDIALGAWLGERSSLCVFRETCGDALALEHTGDVFSCDHFVGPDYRLGNLMTTSLTDLANSAAQRRFGVAKAADLPTMCRTCAVRFVCNGGCPKNRFTNTPAGEPGLNYLCAGYKAFFTHIDRAMSRMAQLLRSGRAPAGIMKLGDERASS